FFANLDGWDTVMELPLEERVAVLANPDRRAELREAAMRRQRRRPGVLGRFVPWSAIVVSKTFLPTNRSLQGRGLAQLADERRTHVADVMLDLAVEERLETERSRSMWAPGVDCAPAGCARPRPSLPPP